TFLTNGRYHQSTARQGGAHRAPRRRKRSVLTMENTMQQAGAASRGLSGTALKLVALVCMVLDHIHYFFAFTGAVPVWFSMAGRLAAPLFTFCLAEGFAHTHSRRRYFLRVAAVAVPMGALRFF